MTLVHADLTYYHEWVFSRRDNVVLHYQKRPWFYINRTISRPLLGLPSA